VTRRAADGSRRAQPVELRGRSAGAGVGSRSATRRPRRSPTGARGHRLDLTDRVSVAAFADWLAATQGTTLDVLGNNAGIHLDLRSEWTEPRLTADGHELHRRTNYLGTMHLTHLLLPAVTAAAGRTGDARVVTVAFKLHVRGRNEFLFRPLEPYHSWNAYGLSKLALVHASNQLAARYADRGVRSYFLHPGTRGAYDAVLRHRERPAEWLLPQLRGGRSRSGGR
jgi:NAD(P)-dependent dehydrogenase (short-subunit alcohol dehydrogenase family)